MSISEPGNPYFRGDESVTDPVASTVNAYWSILIGPDGSKDGWDADEWGDTKRSAFKAWLRSHGDADDGSSALEWVEIEYGSDNWGVGEPGARVADSEWADKPQTWLAAEAERT